MLRLTGRWCIAFVTPYNSTPDTCSCWSGGCNQGGFPAEKFTTDFHGASLSETISSPRNYLEKAGSDWSVVGVLSKNWTLTEEACCSFSPRIWAMQLHLQKQQRANLRGDTPCNSDKKFGLSLSCAQSSKFKAKQIYSCYKVKNRLCCSEWGIWEKMTRGKETRTCQTPSGLSQ